ncbi:MAG TPA: hypothetical protein VJ842_13755 [Pyrinomonadaceae bacterium]|nr:hypothetical protein [Pyrinomonadaceae bacterium]
MRRSNLAIAFVLLALLAACAKAQAQVEERVQFKDGRVSFVPPAGFKPMSKEDINFKYGRNGAAFAPDFAYSANDRHNVSVAFGAKGSGLPPIALDELKKMMEKQLESGIPGLEWIAREIVTLNGTRWVRLHLKAQAIDTGIINDMYFTAFDGQLLLFNFNSTIAQHEKYKESLLKSAQTITVK